MVEEKPAEEAEVAPPADEDLDEDDAPVTEAVPDDVAPEDVE